MQPSAMIYRIYLSVFLVCVLLYTTEAAISGWTSPTITGKDGSGAISVSEGHATSDSITTFDATTDSLPITYTLHTAVTPFDLSNAGVLTITSTLAGTTDSYTLEIQAVDSQSPTPDTGTATVTVRVTTGVNEAPVFGQTSYTALVTSGSKADTSLLTVSASDPNDGDKLTYSIDPNGNTNSDFKIESTSGEIKVNTGKILNMTVTPTYTLIVKAVDNNVTPLTGSTTVSITVTANGNGSGGGGNGSGGGGNGSGDGGNGSGDGGNGSGGGGNGSGGGGNGSDGGGNGSGATAVAVSTITILLAIFVTL